MRNALLLSNPWNDMRERESTRTADRNQVRIGRIYRLPALTEVDSAFRNASDCHMYDPSARFTVHETVLPRCLQHEIPNDRRGPSAGFRFSRIVTVSVSNRP